MNDRDNINDPYMQVSPNSRSPKNGEMVLQLVVTEVVELNAVIGRVTLTTFGMSSHHLLLAFSTFKSDTMRISECFTSHI